MLRVPTFQTAHAQHNNEAEIFQLHVQKSRRGKEFLLSQAQYLSEAGIFHLHVPRVNFSLCMRNNSVNPRSSTCKCLRFQPSILQTFYILVDPDLVDRHRFAGSGSVSKKLQYTVHNNENYDTYLAMLRMKVNQFSDFPTCIIIQIGLGSESGSASNWRFRSRSTTLLEKILFDF